MVISRVFRLGKPGVRIRDGRIMRGGPFGGTVNIPVSGCRDTWWSRLFGQRVHLLEVHRTRGFQVYTGQEEATHALIFIDPSVDFLFSINPTLALSPVIEVLWEGDDSAKILLAPEGAEFSVRIDGVWVSNSTGMSHSVGVPVLVHRTLFYSVGKGGHLIPSAI